jgi:hypothetical protein
MKILQCDVCHGDVSTGIDQREYFHIAHRELCEACYDKLSAILRPVIRTKQPFNYEWFDRLVRDSIEKAISRSKWDLR